MIRGLDCMEVSLVGSNWLSNPANWRTLRNLPAKWSRRRWTRPVCSVISGSSVTTDRWSMSTNVTRIPPQRLRTCKNSPPSSASATRAWWTKTLHGVREFEPRVTDSAGPIRGHITTSRLARSRIGDDPAAPILTPRRRGTTAYLDEWPYPRRVERSEMSRLLGTLGFALLAVGSGVSFVIQQAVNADLRSALGSAAWAGFISYLGGTLCMLALGSASGTVYRPLPLCSGATGGRGAAASSARSTSRSRSC